MAQHVHFDVTEVLRGVDKTFDALEAQADKTNDYEIAQLRFGRLVERAFAEFIVDEKNRQTPHELVARVTGAGLGKLLLNATANYRCPCVSTRIMEAMDELLTEDVLRSSKLNKVLTSFDGVRGGRA